MARRSAAALMLHVALALSAGFTSAQKQDEPGVQYVETRMPDFKVDYEDAYLCTAVPLPDEPLKLVGIEPLAKQEIAHHMLLFGCEAPASTKPVWECHMTSPCGAGAVNGISHGEQVMYGWGRDAPGMHLPEGAGFSVGPRTGIRTAVLQVHYQIVRPEGDHTGVRLKLTSVPQPRSAGMMTYAVGFVVPAKTKSHHVPNSCCYSGFQPLTGFAFRVHAHALGRNIWMDRQPYGGQSGEPQRLVQQDPQEPQGFYPVTQGLRFLPGDPLTVTCEFDSSQRDVDTYAGSGSKNEMCNMYMMVTSEVPYFMQCGNSHTGAHLNGPGGIPHAARLEPELPSRWKPPPSVASAEAATANHTIGQVSGVDAGEEGDTLWLLHRGQRIWDGNTFAADGEHVADESTLPLDTVLQLSKDDGAVLRSWGRDTLVMPHSLAVDHKDGSVWVTDVGLHQALKFDQSGRPLLAIGQKLQPGHDEKHLCKPTAVAFSRVGDVFIADGYCNSRVMQYTSSGKFVHEYKLTEGELNIPHGLVVDDCHEAMYVADRESSAVHQFHMLGRHAAKATAGQRLRRRLLQGLRSSSTGSRVLDRSQQEGRTTSQRRLFAEPTAEQANSSTSAEAGSDSGKGEKAAAEKEDPALPEDGQEEGDIDSAGAPGTHAATYNLSKWGPVYGITAGPYGSVLALCWDRIADRVWLLLLDVVSGEGVVREWEVRGVAAPHDLTLTAAPLDITGAGERALAVYIAETRPSGSSLRKFVLLPEGVELEGTGVSPARATAKQYAAAKEEAMEKAAQAAAAAQQQQEATAKEEAAKAEAAKQAKAAADAKAADAELQKAKQAAALDEKLQQAKAAAQAADSQHSSGGRSEHSVAMVQNPLQEEEQQHGSWRAAGGRLLVMGLPFAAVFMAIAAFMWWRMGGSNRPVRFQPLPRHEPRP